MFATKKDIEDLENQMTRMLATLQISLDKQTREENACKYCAHSAVALMPDGCAKTVCIKRLTAQCGDFIPRSFSEETPVCTE